MGILDEKRPDHGCPHNRAAIVDELSLTNVHVLKPSMHFLYALLCAPLLASFQSSSTSLQQQKLRLGSNITANENDDDNNNAYIFSLQWPTENSFSKPVKDVWRWKDSILGDGRDFFVPKPQTLTALNEYLLRECPTIQECSVLSNCARFEIIVWTDHQYSDTAATESLLSEQISRCLVAQVKSYQNRPFAALQDQLTRFDSPRWIDANAAPETTADVARYLPSVASGVASVAHHLSLIAAGMARRPNRPDRPVPFRPFSSRDAHILLQLKRTPMSRSNEGGSNNIQLLLNAALSAGKAARDEQKVPALSALRPYGSGGKYTMEAPAELEEAAVDAALQYAIKPAVQACVHKLRAVEMANDVARLRRETQNLATSSKETKWLRKQLHEPTMQLRRGVGDIDAIVTELKEKLEEQRVAS